MVTHKFSVQGKEKLRLRWDSPETAKHYVQDRFSHPVWNFLHQKEVGVVNLLIKEIPQANILDLATGPARVAADLTGFKHGTAVDFSPEMLKMAQHRLSGSKSPWKVTVADAFSLHFADAEFDLVTTFRFLRHFDIRDRKKLYSNIHRVLKPGGLLVFEALNENMDRYLFKPQFTGAADHSLFDQLYTKSNLTEELNANGFQLIKLIPNLQFGNLYFHMGNVPMVWKMLDNIDTGRCFQWEVIAMKVPEPTNQIFSSGPNTHRF